MKKLLLFVLAATVFAACSTDTTQDLAPEIPTAPDELQVSFDEEDTRIQLGENGAPVWTEGDLVSVFYRSNANDKWQFQGKTGDTAGTLKRIEATTATQATTKIVAVYPYSKDYWFNWNTGDVEASLPAEQTYLKDSFGLDGTIMVSQSDYNQLSFKNVCGWLKLQFTGSSSISKIVLRGNNGEQVAGKIYINTEDASCTLAAEMGGTNDEGVGGTGGTLIFDDTILTSVTLNCGNGVALNSETPTAFYVALPPQTFEKGFTLEITDNTDFTMSQSTEKMVVIERNHILPMATLEFINPNTPATPTPATNEIWYTATAKVEPEWSDAVVFGANAVSNVFDNDTQKGIITFEGDVTMIGSNAFTDCTSLTSVTIPNSVTTIGYRAFLGCSALTSVTIPDSVTTIGQGAFNSCSSLTSVTIGDDVTTIEGNAFFNCTSLTSVTIPDSVTKIGKSAFSSCSKLTSVTIPDSVTTIEDYAFKGCTSLTSVTIPNSVTTIGNDAFYNCDALTSVTIPDSVTTIGDYAFRNCTSLKAFYGKFASADNRCLIVNGVLNSFAPAGLTTYSIPNSVTKIGGYAFDSCSALTSVTIPDSMTMIGSSAFKDCSALKSVTIPNSVTKIGGYAFYNCDALKEVYCKPTTPPSLGGNTVFDYNASGRRIYVPTASVSAYKSATDWSEYASAIYPYTFTE